MAQQVIKMQLTKSTKGTHVYGDSSPDAPIPSVYIKRAALPSNPPASIEITIGYQE
jgi:hypothetical protein